MSLAPLEGGVCAPAGFRAAGVAAGIKRSGALDLALVVSDHPAAAAGVFTTNRAAAAPVRVSRGRVASGRARAVVLNAGCANAMTGKRGLQDAGEMAGEAAAHLGLRPEDVLVCSTGLIGSYLPMDRVRAGIAAAAGALGPDDLPAATAIMTTDTRPKRAAVAHASGFRVGGMAKGAGMIAPDMATMLAVLTTDGAAGPAALRTALAGAADRTFNAVTIDGDTSTNDAVLLLANGASGVTPPPEALATAVEAVCRSLAEAIAADGEGATKLVRVRVRGAATPGEARRAARTVAESLLVKTALYGGDANWGRVAAAIGRAGVEADFDRLTIAICGVAVLDAGVPASGEALARARAALHGSEADVVCDLMAGAASAEVLTTDLSPEYVLLNAAYEGGPAPEESP